MQSITELWYDEPHTEGTKLHIKINRELYHGESDFQEISVLESADFGRILVLDGRLMLTQKDEFMYHEMITHPAMAVHPGVKRALIIGGGDGGVLRQLTQYKGIEKIDLVDIDGAVVDVAREYFPEMTQGFDDPRLTLHFEDGLRFVRSASEAYDLIIVDSTDPFGPGESLFTREFYGNCFNALTDRGIMVNQHESPFYDREASEAVSAHEKTMAVFPLAFLYQAHIPTYPSGHWLFGFNSKYYNPIVDYDPALFTSQNIPTSYYNPDVHRACFCLPNYVLNLLGGQDLTKMVRGREK